MRLEKWYIPLLQSITDKINALASKRSFQRNGGEIMLVGVEGDVLYGARTKYEWLALIEDIDRGVKVGVLKHRPKNRRFRFPEDFEEEVSDWAAKKGKHRVAIICSCPSRLGDDTTISVGVRQHRVLLVPRWQPRRQDLRIGHRRQRRRVAHRHGVGRAV